MKFETVTLPASWAGALINGDASGLTDEELDDLDDWCEMNVARCVGCDGESVLARSPSGLLTLCRVYTFDFSEQA